MTIDREKLLNTLQMVRAGLSTKELLEQSNCFVFKDGWVFTFNDEVACRKKCELSLEGAVTAAPLLAMLEKIPDKTLEVLINKNNQMEFRAKTERWSNGRDAEVILPIEKVTEETPKIWGKLPPLFGEIIERVKDCVSTDEANNWSLTCIHFHPKFIEACDNKQMIRWHISIGNPTSLLVRGTAIEKVVGLGVNEVAATKSWIHFKNSSGLIFSCRKFVEEYPPGMDEVLVVKGNKIQLPKTVVDVSDRASIIAAENPDAGDNCLTITLWPGHMRVDSTGQNSFYQGIRKCAYNGPKFQFCISPGLLEYICRHYNDAQITERKFKATGGAKDKSGYWEYVTMLGKLKKPAPAPVPVAKDPEGEEAGRESEDDVPF